MTLDAVCEQLRKCNSLQWEVKGRDYDFCHKLGEGEAGSTETAIHELKESCLSLSDGKYIITHWGDGALRRTSAQKLAYFKNDSGQVNNVQNSPNSFSSELAELKALMVEQKKDHEIQLLKINHAAEIKALKENEGSGDGLEKFSKILGQLSQVMSQSKSSPNISGREREKRPTAKPPQNSEINGTEEQASEDIETEMAAKMQVIYEKLGNDYEKALKIFDVMSSVKPETLETLQTVSPETLDQATNFLP